MSGGCGALQHAMLHELGDTQQDGNGAPHVAQPVPRCEGKEMLPQTRAMLSTFFAPYNALLGAQLEDSRLPELWSSHADDAAS